MKKLFMFSLLLILFGCSKSEEAFIVKGYWELDKSNAMESGYVFDFKRDGKCRVFNGQLGTTARWEVNDSHIKVFVKGSEESPMIDADFLLDEDSIYLFGKDLHLRRVDSFPDDLWNNSYVDYEYESEVRDEPQKIAPNNKKSTEICRKNLKIIWYAKNEWAMVMGKPKGSLVPANSLDEFREVSSLNCPCGGAYTVEEVGISPSCSFHASLSVK